MSDDWWIPYHGILPTTYHAELLWLLDHLDYGSLSEPIPPDVADRIMTRAGQCWNDNDIPGPPDGRQEWLNAWRRPSIETGRARPEP